MKRHNYTRQERVELFKQDIRVIELYKTYKVRPLNVLEKIILTQLKQEYGI